MRSVIKNLGVAAAAVTLILGMAITANAGQVNLSGRVTVISETITTGSTASTITRSINVNGLSETIISAAGSGTVVRNVTITETFNSTTATVSFELAQDGVNYTSPYDNIFVGTMTQTVGVGSSSGLTNLQNTAGAGNVSVGSNALLDVSALFSAASIGALNGSAVGASNALTLALVPGFALQNSNINALVLAATNAIAGSQGGSVTAIDVEQNNLNEYSPHGNLALGAIAQTVSITAASGITNVQNQAGAGNVQAFHTVVAFGSSISGTIF